MKNLLVASVLLVAFACCAVSAATFDKNYVLASCDRFNAEGGGILPTNCPEKTYYREGKCYMNDKVIVSTTPYCHADYEKFGDLCYKGVCPIGYKRTGLCECQLIVG